MFVAPTTTLPLLVQRFFAMEVSTRRTIGSREGVVLFNVRCRNHQSMSNFGNSPRDYSDTAPTLFLLGRNRALQIGPDMAASHATESTIRCVELHALCVKPAEQRKYDGALLPSKAAKGPHFYQNVQQTQRAKRKREHE